MMTREARAKQFMPFDAMKGLQEALRDREERHSRVEKRMLSEEQREEIADSLCRMEKGMRVRVIWWCAFHDRETEGRISCFNPDGRFLKVGEEKILFEDIYEIEITDLRE